MQDCEDLEAQLACKEREWKELQALRIQQLESALADATNELSTLRERFLRLRDDFQYNLRVLEERDRELERYDAMSVRVQTEDSARKAEISELRIMLAKCQDAMTGVSVQKEDLQVQYQKRGVEHRRQLARVQSVKEAEIQRLREENEALRRDLHRRIQESDGELALQKQEMMADFDSEVRKREHEFNLRLDEMHSVVLSHELKVQLLNKELEVHAKAHSEATEALQQSEQLYQKAQKEILHRDWNLKNMSAVKDSRIKELEEKLNQMEAKHKKEVETNNRKHAELERRARDRQAALEALKEAHTSDLHEEQRKASEIQLQLDSLLLEKDRREKGHAEELEHRERQIQELHAQLEKTQTGWDAYVTQVSKEMVAKDTELLSAGDREARVRAELQRCKQDLERYKQQLASGLQREQALEQKHVQLELDWESRCEKVRNEHYLKSEELIQGLTQSRDQLNAELKEKERELQEMVALLKSVTMERDQALLAAKTTSNTTSQVAMLEGSKFPSDEIQRLQQQNSSLREVITEMRKQMESLSRDVPLPQNQTTTQHSALVTAGAAEYNQALEEELQNMKAKCRSLEDKLQEASKRTSPASALAPGLHVDPENAYLQNHIRSLNETIGGLQAEKVASSAALKKQEVRLAHLESMVTQLTQQVSALKLDIASRQEPIVLEQSDMMKQLQEENRSLSQQQLLLQCSGRGGAADVHQLRSKLKQAARWISRLSQDKQQLIEMGNRLRAQLIEAGLEVSSHSETGARACPSGTEPSKPESDTQPRSRLSALEELQYKLTTQELQYAQRDQNQKKPIVVRPRFSGSESGHSDINPWEPATQIPRSGSKENAPPVLSHTEGAVQRTSSPQIMLSSVNTDESLHDVWKLLDHGWSSTGLTSSNNEDQDGCVVPVSAAQDRSSPHGSPVRVQSLKAPVQERKKLIRTTAGPVKKIRPVTKAIKVRNYNIKD